MNKKGQLAIFVLVAIVVVGGIAFFYFFEDFIFGERIPESIKPAYDNFLSCLEAVGSEGVYYVASHGGYYNVPNETSIVYFTEDIPYYYLDSEYHIPPVSLIERELTNYVSDNLESCFDLNILREQGFEINIKNYSVSAEISGEKVKMNTINLLTIRKGGDVKQFKDIEVILDYDVKKLYVASREVVMSYAEKPGAICLTCLEDITEKNDVSIKTVPVTDVSIFENDIIWFFIADKNNVSENKLIWTFVVEQ